MPVRPLGLPVGRVRALLLLALGIRAIYELRFTHGLSPWLVVALLLSAASYFAARAAAVPSAAPVPGAPMRRGRPPLGLPTGTVRLVFLVFAVYGTWLWFRDRDLGVGGAPAVCWVLAAYVLGIVAGGIVRRSRAPDAAEATPWDHALALVTLIAAAGLVWLAVAKASPPTWVEPLLGALVVHYFAAR